MDLEITIISNEEEVKKYLRSISNRYLQDFLLREVVFVNVSGLEKLQPIITKITWKEEQKGYLL